MDTRKNGEDKLFRAMSKDHGGIQPCTISRWIKQCIEESNQGKHTAHSVRAMAAMQASQGGLTTRQIMNAVEWKDESVYKNHYYNEHNAAFGRAVLGMRRRNGDRSGKQASSGAHL